MDLPDRTIDAPYTLEAPACPEAVSWARTFAASLAAACGVEPDTCDDIRLAVSEVTSVIVAHGEPHLHIDAYRDQLLTLFIGPWPTSEPDAVVSPRDIVDALFDDVQAVDGWLVLRVECAPLDR